MEGDQEQEEDGDGDGAEHGARGGSNSQCANEHQRVRMNKSRL